VLLEINIGSRMFNPLVITTEELKAKAEFAETELGIIDKLHKVNPIERVTSSELHSYLSENPYNSPNLQLSIRTLTRVRSASFDIDRQDLKNI
jgi:hypothetical protein